jgi:hypothetical protein
MVSPAQSRVATAAADRHTSPVGEPGAGAGERPLGRRSAVPGGRAIIGALLVVLAALLTWVAYTTATAGPTQTYVVAQRDLQVNQRVSAGDFRTIVGELPPEAVSGVFRSPDRLDGAVVLSPVAAGQLVVAGAVLLPDSQGARADGYEVSFTVPRSRLGGNRLRVGELVDIVPTGDARTGSATAPVRGVRVVDLQEASGSGMASGGGDVIVVVVVPGVPEYTAVIGAVKDQFWIVRSTRAPESPPPATTPAPSAPPTTTRPPSTTSGNLADLAPLLTTTTVRRTTTAPPTTAAPPPTEPPAPPTTAGPP